MEMKCVKVFDTGEIIPENVKYRHGFSFANGTIKAGDTVCIWFKDDSVMSGRLDRVDSWSIDIRQNTARRWQIKFEEIAYIAKKENGKWKLMREAKDGKA